MASQTYFTVKDPLGKRIRTTREYWQKIIQRNKHNVCVVTRHEDGTGFIITAYITSRISEGEIVWEV